MYRAVNGPLDEGQAVVILYFVEGLEHECSKVPVDLSVDSFHYGVLLLGISQCEVMWCPCGKQEFAYKVVR